MGLIQISLAAEAVGIAVGLIVAIARVAAFRPVRLLAIAYIDFFRGIPVLAMLLFVYFGFSIFLGINFTVALQVWHRGTGANLRRVHFRDFSLWTPGYRPKANGKLGGRSA